jgi:hypothetical protein
MQAITASFQIVQDQLLAGCESEPGGTEDAFEFT